MRRPAASLRASRKRFASHRSQVCNLSFPYKDVLKSQFRSAFQGMANLIDLIYAGEGG